jgi:hypothetical protein
MSLQSLRIGIRAQENFWLLPRACGLLRTRLGQIAMQTLKQIIPSLRALSLALPEAELETLLTA